MSILLMDKYGVIGNPVEHSLSPLIHEAFSKQTKQKFVYQKIKAPLDGFAQTVQQFQREGGKGLNITLPFKREAYQLSTECSHSAKETHTASVLHFRADHVIYGDNFDGFGLMHDLTRNHRINLNKQKILIVGAGGAAQGILGSLLDQSPAQVVIVNRTAAKSHELANKFLARGSVQGISFSELAPSHYDVIIHVTSIGHQGEVPPLPRDLITADTCCYDISYTQAAQPFLNWAKKQGAKKCFDGLGMLVEHNAAVFNLWFGIYPKTQPVIQYLRQQFSKNDHVV